MSTPPPGKPKDRSYEPPRLTPVGNLRDLLGKSGPLPDRPGPNPTRQA